MSWRLGWLVVVALCALGLRDGGDVVAARAIGQRAEQLAGDDPGAPIWVDVHREWAKIRPWQAGFHEARGQLAVLHERRRSLLR